MKPRVDTDKPTVEHLPSEKAMTSRDDTEQSRVLQLSPVKTDKSIEEHLPPDAMQPRVLEAAAHNNIQDCCVCVKQMLKLMTMTIVTLVVITTPRQPDKGQQLQASSTFMQANEISMGWAHLGLQIPCP